MNLKIFAVVSLTFAGICAMAQDCSWGVVTVSTSNTYNDGNYNAGAESEILLGTPVKILDTREEWIRIQTPDGYEHWTLAGSVASMSRNQLSEWNAGGHVIVTSLWGLVYQQPSAHSQVISDIVAGNRLKLLGRKGHFYHVGFPDGREGYLARRDAETSKRWFKELDNSVDGILQTAHSLIGIPYLYGGVSVKGADCSGFVSGTFFLHGIIVPRNASQQAYKGERIEIGDFSNLHRGDLLFFGRPAENGKKERVEHVAFYLGDKRFLHSLGRGVRICSFNPADEHYDEYDLNRLLFACRILPYINVQEGLLTTDKSEFYR